MQQQRLVYFNEDYLSRSWAMLAASPGWLKPVLLLTLVSFIPVVGPIFVLGYALEWARLTAWGINSSPKQTGVDVGGCLSTGLRGVLVVICWAIPWGLIAALIQNLLGVLPIASNIISLIVGVLSTFVGVVGLVAALRATIYQRFGAGVGISIIIEMIQADLEGLLRVVGISFFGGLITSIVCGIIMTVGSVGIVPALISLAEELETSNLSDAAVFGRLFGSILSGLGPAIALTALVGSFISTLFSLVTTNAVGLWMLQFNVPAWGDKDAPLPPRIPSAPREWHAPAQPVVPAAPAMPTSTIQWDQAQQPVQQLPQQPAAPEAPAQAEEPGDPAAPTDGPAQ